VRSLDFLSRLRECIPGVPHVRLVEVLAYQHDFPPPLFLFIELLICHCYNAGLALLTHE